MWNTLLKCGFALFSLSAHAQFNGVPFRDDVARCESVTETVTPLQQAVITANMGQHAHRLYHWLWHSSRNGWDSLSVSDRNLLQQISPNWGRHQPICPNPDSSNQSVAGEEFLRMHHQMIDFLREQFVANKLPCLTGWTTPPESLDPYWPVPPGMPGDSSKGPEIARLIQVWSQTLLSPEYLRSKTLSEIGHLVEFSIHNNLHMRFATLALPGDQFSPPLTGATPASLSLSSGFDGPQYQYLGNPYSAAVNPTFWKIHGFVDNIVVAWLSANGYSAISDNCRGDFTCYEWRSLWSGGMGYDRRAVPSEPTGGSGHHHGHQMNPSGGNADISPLLDKLTGTVSFRNEAFDRFLKEPRGGAGEDLVGATTPYDDPAEFVRQFGPCP